MIARIVIALMLAVPASGPTTGPGSRATPHLRADAPQGVKDACASALITLRQNIAQANADYVAMQDGQIMQRQSRPVVVVAAKNGSGNHYFRASANKDSALATQEDEIRRLNESLDHPWTEIKLGATIKDWKVGVIGRAKLSTVKQVVDARAAIVLMRPVDEGGKECGGMLLSGICLQGIDTSKLIDGADMNTIETIFISGTQSYESVGSGRVTILRAEIFKIENYLE